MSTQVYTKRSLCETNLRDFEVSDSLPRKGKCREGIMEPGKLGEKKEDLGVNPVHPGKMR